MRRLNVSLTLVTALAAMVSVSIVAPAWAGAYDPRVGPGGRGGGFDPVMPGTGTGTFNLNRPDAMGRPFAGLGPGADMSIGSSVNVRGNLASFTVGVYFTPTNLDLSQHLAQRYPDLVGLWAYMTDDQKRAILDAWTKANSTQADLDAAQGDQQDIQGRLEKAQGELTALVEEQLKPIQAKIALLRRLRSVNQRIIGLRLWFGNTRSKRDIDTDIRDTKKAIEEEEKKLEDERNLGVRENIQKTINRLKRQLRRLETEKRTHEEKQKELEDLEKERQGLLDQLGDLYGDDAAQFGGPLPGGEDIARAGGARPATTSANGALTRELDRLLDQEKALTKGKTDDGRAVHDGEVIREGEDIPAQIPGKQGEVAGLQGELDDATTKVTEAEEANKGAQGTLDQAVGDAMKSAQAAKDKEEADRKERERLEEEKKKAAEAAAQAAAALAAKKAKYRLIIQVIQGLPWTKFTGALTVLIKRLGEDGLNDLVDLAAGALDDPDNRAALLDFVRNAPKYVAAAKQGTQAVTDFVVSGTVQTEVTTVRGYQRRGKGVLGFIQKGKKLGLAGVFPIASAAGVIVRVGLLWWQIFDPALLQASSLYPLTTIMNSDFVTNPAYSALWGASGAGVENKAQSILQHIQDFYKDMTGFAKELNELMQDEDIKGAMDELENNPDLQKTIGEGLDQVATQQPAGVESAKTQE